MGTTEFLRQSFRIVPLSKEELFCKYVGECKAYRYFFKNRAGIITGPVALCGLDPNSTLWNRGYLCICPS